MSDLQKLIFKKKSYISVRSIESKEYKNSDISLHIQNMIQAIVGNGDVRSYITEGYGKMLTNDIPTKVQYDRFLNIVSRYGKDYTIVKDSFLADGGCNYRIDIKFPSNIELIGDKYYRIFLTSCDLDQLKIDNLSYIDDINNIFLLTKLDCNMLLNKISIGNIILEKEGIKYKMKVSGNLQGLDEYKGKRMAIHVHTQGDISDECKKCGTHFNPTFQFHGDISGERHLGDLGNILVDMNGQSNFIIYVTTFPLPNDLLLSKMLGRSIVLHSGPDDLGEGNNLESSKSGNSGKRVACGILGGIYE
jgi:Cu-Zn family superoxide dismutase